MPLTNGRGAFSSSLDEYAMDACLQHNKEFVRLEKRWGKFTMGTLRRRTMGFVGFGGIAKMLDRGVDTVKEKSVEMAK